MKKILMIVACGLVGLPAAGQAQQSMTDEEQAWFDLIRTDVRAQKAAMVGEALSLPADKAAVFWPLYEEYEGELKMIWDSHLELIEAYAASYDNMTDEVANTLAEWAMDLEIQRIQLLRETFRKMADNENIGAVTAAHFIQLENRLDMLVNMEIMTALPMLEPMN
jgi:hypothetical protein